MTTSDAGSDATSDAMPPATSETSPADSRVAALSPRRRALFEALRAQAARPAGSRAPGNDVERRLLRVYRDVLDIADVGVEDDFIELGGDSVGAVLVAARCAEDGLVLTTRDIFEARTVAALAPRCRAVTADPDTDEPVGSPDQGRSFPLTPLQQTILAHATGGRAYISQLAAELTGPLDTAALIHAWQVVTARHEALRVQVDVDDGRWSQRIADRVAMPVEVVDLRGEPDLVARTSAWRAEHGRPFAWDHAPLSRVLLARTGDDRWLLVWTHSHLMIDGWSEHIVADEVLRLATGGVSAGDLSAPVPLIPVLAAPERPAERERALAAWRTRLAGAQPTLVAGSGPFPGGRPHHVATVTMTDDQVTALDRLALAGRTTLAACVLAAWGLVVVEATGRTDALFGVTVNGRTAPQRDVVGMLVDTVPMRILIDPEQGFGELAHTVGQRLAEWTSDDAPPLSLSSIRDAAGLPREVPMFDAIAVVQNVPSVVLPGDCYGELEVRDISASDDELFPLLLDVTIRDRVQLTVRWDPDRASRGDVDAWLHTIADIGRPAGARVADVLDGVRRGRHENRAAAAAAGRQRLRGATRRGVSR